ncbi:MAG: ribonuclease III [Pseudomonadota bacterium]
MRKPAKPKRRAPAEASHRAAKAERRGAAAPLASLETALGHAFADRALLERALTHGSAAGRRDEGGAADNQRLEFLGDRVLGLLTAEALLRDHPFDAEGALAPRLNALVRRETCAEVAQRLDLGRYLRMAPSEAASGGRRKTALLGDAMEAVIAAVYCDGGLNAARAAYARLWGPALAAQTGAPAPIDAKTALQEWAQARGLAPPTYRLIARDGPDHAPRFKVAAELETGARAEAEGASKRAAEQDAAASLLAAAESEASG